MNRIDQIENTSDQQISILKQDLNDTTKRVSSFSQDIVTVKNLSIEINDKYKEILSIGSKAKELDDKLSKIAIQIESLDAKINSLEKNQVRIEGNMNSSQNIVTWVTLIVSVLVIIIGLFFSKLFLDLYSNYQVLRSHMPTLQTEKE